MSDKNDKIIKIFSAKADPQSHSIDGLKCYKCKKDNGLVFAAVDSNGIKQLVAVCEDCQNMPDSSYAKIILTCDGVKILDEKEIDKNKLAEALGNKKQRDLLFVAFKMVHANKNKNGDAFTESDLKLAEKTPIHKPLNWEHGEPNIGVIYDSKFRKSSKDEDAYLEVAAAIWKYKYPVHSKEVLKRHEKGELSFSMEVWYKKYACSECNESFLVEDGDDNICSHMRMFNSARANGIFPKGFNTYRILHEICFGGAGVVEIGADEDATSLAIASASKNDKGVNSLGKENENSDLKYTEADLKDAVERALSESKSKEEHEKAIADMATKLDEASNSLKSKETELASAIAERDGFKKELDELKASIALEKTIASRIEALVGDNFEIPEEEAELAEFKKFVGDMTDESFNTWAKFQKKNMKKDMEDMMEDEEDDKKKKAKSKAGDETEGSSKGSVKVPRGSLDLKEKGNKKSISVIDEILGKMK